MKLIQCFSALLIAAIVKAQGVKVNATTTPPTVKDGDGCFQDGISFGSTTGEKRSDANLAVTLSSSHQIYELKACTDGTIKDKPLKGLIVTAGVYSDDGKEVEYKTKLTEFGDINPPFCKVVTFAKGERIQELTIFYTDSKVLGFGYLTNQATRFEYGQKKIDDIFNPIQIKKVTFEDQQPIIGFTGVFTKTEIRSIGPVRADLSCANFAKLPEKQVILPQVIQPPPPEEVLVVEDDSHPEQWKIILIAVIGAVFVLGLISTLVICLLRRRANSMNQVKHANIKDQMKEIGIEQQEVDVHFSRKSRTGKKESDALAGST